MNEAAILISLLNSATVSVFGGLLSASFCGALDTRRNRRIFWAGMALMIIAQGMVCFFWDTRFWARVYPFVVHLPLLATLRALTGRWLWPAFSIVSAYLFCEMRRWLALLAAAPLMLYPGALTDAAGFLLLAGVGLHQKKPAPRAR